MSYLLDLEAVKTATHSDVTVKSAPSSISPSNVGGNIENLITTVQTGDIDKILSLGNTVSNRIIRVRDGSGNLVSEIQPGSMYVFSADGAEYVGILSANGSGNSFLTMKRGGNILNVVAAQIADNQTQHYLDASGSIPVVVASADLTAQSGAGVSISIPIANTANFTISGYINVTTYTSGTIYLAVSFKDVHGTTVSGYRLGAATTSGFLAIPAQQIRARAGFNISVSFVDGVGTNVFDVGAVITQLTSI